MSGARGVAEVYREQWSTHLNAEVTKALRQALSETPPDPVYRVGQLLTNEVVGEPPRSSTPAGIVLDYNAIWFDHVHAIVTRAMKQTLLQRPDNPVVCIGRLLLAASSTGTEIAVGARGWAVGTPSSKTTATARAVAAGQPENPRLVTELQQQLAAAKEEVLSLRLSLKQRGAANANAATPSAARAALAPSPAKLTLPEDDSSGASDKWNLPKWSRGAGVHRVIAAALQQAMADMGLGADTEASVAEAAAALAATKTSAAAKATVAEENAAAAMVEEVAAREALEAALAKARQAQADAVLCFLKGLNGRGELDALLRTEAVMDGLVDLLWQEVMQLQTAGAPTSKDIQGKFAGSIEMSYSGLDTFFGGLEGVIGTPNAKLFAAMESEHTTGVDATQEFTTGCAHNPTRPSLPLLSVDAHPLSPPLTPAATMASRPPPRLSGPLSSTTTGPRQRACPVGLRSRSPCYPTARNAGSRLSLPS